MADETHNHTYALRADFDQLLRGLRDLTDGFDDAGKASEGTDKKTKKLAPTLKETAKSTAKAASGLLAVASAGLAVGAGMVAMGNDIAATHVEMRELSTQSGLAIDTINALRVASGATGGEMSDLIPDDFGERMLDATQSGNDAAAAMGALGVKVTDSRGQLRDTTTVLDETIEALRGVDNEAARAGLTTLALGENGGRMMAALGDRRLTDFVDETSRFGLDVGPEAVKLSAEWSKTTGALGLAWEDTKDAIFQAVGPTIIEGFKNLAANTIFLSTAAGVAASNFNALLSGNFSEIKLWGALLREAGNESKAFFDTFLEGGEQFVGPTLDMLQEETKDWAKALEDPKTRLDAIKAAQAQLEGIARTANDGNLEGMQAINAAYREQLLLIFDLGQTGADTSGAIAAAQEAHANAVRDFNEEMAAAFQETSDEFHAIGDEAGEAIASGYLEAADIMDERAKELAASQRETFLMMADEIAGAFGDAAAGFSDIVNLQMEKTLELQEAEGEVLDERKEKIKTLREEARAEEQAGNSQRAAELRNQADSIAAKNRARKEEIQGIEDTLQKQHKAAVAAFKLEQAAAIASVITQSFATAATLATALVPILGPAAPIVAGAIAATSAAGQIASISAQQPPEAPASVLHDGGLATDEFRFGGNVLRGGEAVLNQRATEGLGADGVDALNRGAGLQSGSATLVLQHAGETIGEAWLQVANSATQTGRDIRAALDGALPAR